MKYAICLQPYIPMRAEAAEQSEMTSQLLFGDTFRIIDEQPRWYRIVRDCDQYEGWIDWKTATLIDKIEYQRYVDHTEDAPLLRLPFFAPAAKVADLEKGRPCAALPEPRDLLCRALERGIADSVRNHGFTGACVPLDHPNGTLLAALCAAALGTSHVCGLSFAKDTPAAKELGITVRRLDAPADDKMPEATRARLCAAIATAAAEELGYMLICPLARQDIMMGNFTLYAETCGGLAPLGNLYEMDLHMLKAFIQEEHAGLFGALTEPHHPETDRIIHELVDRNIPASELIHNTPLFEENEVRRVQRRIIASALKRTQLPTILHVDSPAEQIHVPTTHRLND